MNDCKRMLVVATGIDMEGNTVMAANGNLGTCTEEPGNCGCVHAEMNLLEKMPHPAVVFITHSPCLKCAKALVDAGVNTVHCIRPYRLQNGVNYLIDKGVRVKWH